MKIRNVAGPGFTVGVDRVHENIVGEGETPGFDIDFAVEPYEPPRVHMTIHRRDDRSLHIWRQWADTADVRAAAFMIRAAVATGADAVPLAVVCSCGCGRVWSVWYDADEAAHLADALDEAADLTSQLAEIRAL